jgi:lipopolysaccharide biosynthesis glycosyltransferase
MNVIYSSDNNYARHVGIAITSLYDHNQSMEDLTVYLIDDNISPENHKKLDEVAERYGRKIEYIPFGPHKERLVLNNEWELPISAYARLFVADMVPQTVDRLLYMDCDTVVTDSLEELWNTDMQGNTIAAVEDVASCAFWKETGLEQQFRYICSGVILIDLKKWRQIDAQQKCLDYLDRMQGKVRHHDQTILNGVFWDDCLILHPRYDVLTPTFVMSYENLMAYFRLWDRYYSKAEIRGSVKNPAIIHYTSSNVGRPWENSSHPKAGIYQTYWKNSAWKDEPWGTFCRSYDEKLQRTYWLYQHLPVWLIRLISKLRRIGK